MNNGSIENQANQEPVKKRNIPTVNCVGRLGRVVNSHKNVSTKFRFNHKSYNRENEGKGEDNMYIVRGNRLGKDTRIR